MVANVYFLHRSFQFFLTIYRRAGIYHCYYYLAAISRDVTSDKFFRAVYEMEDRSLVLVLYTPPAPGIPHPSLRMQRLLQALTNISFN